MSRKQPDQLTDDELAEEIRITEAEIAALEYRLVRLENESFYRRHPECLPAKHLKNKKQ